MLIQLWIELSESTFPLTVNLMKKPPGDKVKPQWHIFLRWMVRPFSCQRHDKQYSDITALSCQSEGSCHHSITADSTAHAAPQTGLDQDKNGGGTSNSRSSKVSHQPAVDPHFTILSLLLLFVCYCIAHVKEFDSRYIVFLNWMPR